MRVTSRNPCGEIALGETHIMDPEWQIALMNDLRRRKGEARLTDKEMDDVRQTYKDGIGGS